MQAEKILSSGKNNPAIPGGLPKACLKATFESSKTFGLFTSYFDEELYHYAASFYDTHVFGCDRRIYSIVGVTRVLEDVEISQRNHPLYRDMQRYLEQDFSTIHTDAQLINKLAPYLTARVDAKLRVEGDFQIFNVSDNRAKITKPAWFQNNGVGYVITSYVGKLEFTAKAAVDGQIAFFLRGVDVRRPEDNSKRIIYWIDYTKMTVNGRTLFDKLMPTWHDKPYSYSLNVKAGEEVKVQVEWLPHRSDT